MQHGLLKNHLFLAALILSVGVVVIAGYLITESYKYRKAYLMDPHLFREQARRLSLGETTDTVRLRLRNVSVIRNTTNTVMFGMNRNSPYTRSHFREAPLVQWINVSHDDQGRVTAVSASAGRRVWKY